MRVEKLDRWLGGVGVSLLGGYNAYLLASVFKFYQGPKYLAEVLLFSCMLLVASMYIKAANRALYLKREPVILILFLLASTLVSIMLQGTFARDAVAEDGRSAHDAARAVYVGGVGWLVSGGLCQLAVLRRSNILALSIIILILLLISENVGSAYVVSYSALKMHGDFSAISHLTIGSSCVFLFCLSLSLSTGWVKTIVTVAGMAALYALEGRATFYLFPAALLLYYIARGSIAHVAVSIFTIGALVSVSALFGISGSGEMLFSEGFLSDGSAKARLDQFQVGFSMIPAQILFGAPELLVQKFGSIGSYMHNILSVIQFYGIIPFISFVAATVFCLKNVLRHAAISDRPVDQFGSIIMILAAMEVMVAKSVYYHLFWFALGFWLFRAASAGSSVRLPSR